MTTVVEWIGGGAGAGSPAGAASGTGTGVGVGVGGASGAGGVRGSGFSVSRRLTACRPSWATRGLGSHGSCERPSATVSCAPVRPHALARPGTAESVDPKHPLRIQSLVTIKCVAITAITAPELSLYDLYVMANL